jgi:hypothetical protein
MTFTYMRINRARSFSCTVIDYAQRLIEPTAIADLYKDKDGEWDRSKWLNWYYRRFLGDNPDLSTGSARPLDIHRAKWRTAANIAIYFDNARDAFVECGLATLNPRYDASDIDPATDMPKEVELFWLDERAGRAFSFDETRVKKDTHDGAKRRCETMVRVGKDDDGETLASKSQSGMTGVGGSYASLDGGVGYFVNSSMTLDLNWLLAGPRTVIAGRTFAAQVCTSYLLSGRFMTVV